MRILHVVPTYWPAVRYGGPIYSVHALCRALVARGHKVDVYTTNVDGSDVSNVPLAVPTAIDGVTVQYFPCATGRRIYRSPDMGRALESDLKNFDIVHLHSVFLWPTLTAARSARRLGVPYVLAPRGMLVRTLISQRNWLAKTLWINAFERTTIAGAAAIHVTSELEAKELMQFNFETRMISIIANGIDAPPTQFLPPSRVLKSPYVLALGRVTWKKGLDRLIRAMHHISEARLIIVGNDEENYTQHLRSLAYQLGLADRVHFLGPLYGNDKWSIIKSATVFALPSHSENFGVAVLEALSCGCPVVVTSEVGLAHAIRNAGAGIVVDGDPKQLGDAIAALLSDNALRKRMGEAAQRLAQEYSWPKIAERVEHLYESCIADREKRAA